MRAKFCVFTIALLTLIFSQTAIFAQSVFDLPAPESPAERTLKKDEKHVYQIRLEKNRFIQVRVEEIGVGLYLSAFDPDGNLILKSESRNRIFGLEAVSVIAAQAGVYRFEVVPIRTALIGEGKYRIALAALRDAVEQDKELLETERYFMAAMRLADDGTFKSRRESLSNYAAAAAGFQRQHDLERTGAALFQLAHTQSVLGEKRAALENFEKSLKLFRELKDPHHEAVTLRFIGDSHNRAGDREKAIDFLLQSVEIARKIGNTDSEAAGLQHLADVYSQLGETETAIRLYQQALALREANEGQGINSGYFLLNRIGDLYGKQKNWQLALDFYLRAVEANKKSGGVGFHLNSLWRVGAMYVQLGNPNKALVLLNEGRKREENIRNPQRLGSVLLGLGDAYFALGEKQKALGHFRESAAAFQSISNATGEAFAHFSAARVELDSGNLDAAQKEIETTLELVESLRSRLNNLDFRVSYFATAEDYHDFYMELLWRQHAKSPRGGFDRKAWAATELARARTLAEMLLESKVDIRQGVAPDLLLRERDLQTLLNEKADLHLQLTSEANLADAAEMTLISGEIQNLIGQLADTRTKIRQASPRYAEMVQPNAPNLPDVQNGLDANTVILEYKLGAQRSFLWLVGNDSLEQFQLPPGAEIQSLARRFYEQISSRKPEAQSDGASLSEKLSAILLGPVTEKIKNKRLVVIADGALQLVPFASLTIPDSKFQIPNSTTRMEQKQSEIWNLKSGISNNQFLIETNEIINLPSASILPLLRDNLPVRGGKRKTLALFADAVFTSDDTRLPSRNTAAAGQVEIKFNQPDSRLRLSRLPFSRREANAIMAISPPAESFAALDFAANRETVLKTDLSQFRIVHFATHGWLDSERPQLSGIVLSLVNERGERREGFLRLHEIYNLNLSADLVVLSACQTGLGKTIGNEGVIGLARGFMYAGSSRVISSLWNVDDAATSELMRVFYQKLLREKLSPAAALRAAQIALFKQRRWQSPYFWAAFSIQGEWK